MSMSEESEMRDEYDFSGGERGKYARRFETGSNVVVLDPDVASEFKTRQAVNDALRDQLRSRKSSEPVNKRITGAGRSRRR